MTMPRTKVRASLDAHGHRHYSDRGWTVYPFGDGDPLHGYDGEARFHRRGGVELRGLWPAPWSAKYGAAVPDEIVLSTIMALRTIAAAGSDFFS